MRTAESVNRILVVELWHIGDVVLTAPFLAQVRARFPEAQTTLLAHGYARELFAGTGLVDDFVETDLDWDWERSFNPFRYRLIELLRVATKLRRRRFDIAFQCRPHVREHVLLALSGARRRVGLALGMSDKLLTDPISIDRSDTQKVEQWATLLGPFGRPNTVVSPMLDVSEPERRWARDFLSGKGVRSGDVLVAVHPGAGVPANRWPIDRFMDVARALASRPGVRVLSFVDPQGYGATLSDIPEVISAKVGLRELMALLQESTFLICNDSGPMHVAGALGVPTIATFGWINRWFLPLGEGHEIVRAVEPATDTAIGSGTGDAVSGIPTARVLEVVERKLSEAHATGQVGGQARMLLSNDRR